MAEWLETADSSSGFESITDVITVEKDGEEVTHGWWKTLTEPVMEGAGLVRARPDGVYLERVISYTPTP